MMAMLSPPEHPQMPAGKAPRRFSVPGIRLVERTMVATNEAQAGPATIAVRTIVDAQNAAFGRELVFDDTSQASAQALQLAFRLRELSWATALPAQRTLVRASSELMHSPAIDWLPASAQIFALDLAGAPDAAMLARCRALRDRGFTLALARYRGIDERSAPLLSLLDIVEIDLGDVDEASCVELAGSLAHLPVKLLASGVNTAEQMRFCRRAGFHLFQGAHVAPLESLGTRWLPVSRQSLLRLLALVVEGADATAIEDACKKEPSLIYNLLRLSRVAARPPEPRAFTLQQALAQLDEHSLRYWLEVQLTALEESPDTDAHTRRCVQSAALGGRLLELFARELAPDGAGLPAAAYLAGSLWLMSATLALPLGDFVQHLPIRPEVTRALLRREGVLGQCLEVLEHFDKRDALACERQIRRISQGKLGYPDLQVCFAEALAWLTASAE